MLYTRELDGAMTIARKAGELAMHYFDQETSTYEKPDLSPVTIADRECEALISRSLAETFPDDGILGEEGAFRQSRSGRRWLVDPIDGTRDFVRRNPFWSIQISLQSADEVVLGLIYLPCSDEMFQAASGAGSYWNDVRCSVSNATDLRKSILMVSGFNSETCWTVRCYGGCYDVTMIARGKADIWLSGNGMEWDYGPARIIAQECGAVFCTRSGSDRIDEGNCVMYAPGLERPLRPLLKIGDAKPSNEHLTGKVPRPGRG
jgi:histidinol-phosphatase